MSKFIGLYATRDMTPADRNFILATFLRGLYYGDSWFSAIPKDVFMDNYKKVIAHMIDNPQNTVQVACLKEDPNVILGYSILSSDFQTIHWVFVKAAWRNRGIAKSLVPQFPATVTHLTKVGHTLLPKFQNCIFNPFAPL